MEAPEQPLGVPGTAELGATTRDMSQSRACHFPLTLPVLPMQRMSGFEELTVDTVDPVR